VPFAADTTVGTLMGRLERPIPAAPELGPLGPIVARAGRPDPAERLDAMALGSALQSVAAELPRPEPLPLVGVAALDDTVGHVDPDPTDVGVPPPVPPSTVTTVDLPDAAPTVALPTTPGATTGAPPDSPTVAGPAPALAPAATALSRKARRRRWPLVTAIVVAALLAAIAAVYAVVKSQVPSHRVPDEVGRPEAEAVAAVKALHLNPKVERRFADGTTAGVVLGQAPRSGSLEEGRNVTLTVSRGPTPVPVPDLTGRSKDQAVDVLAQAGFRLGKLTPRNDESAPAGVVLDWSPKGVEAPRGTAVDLVVSAGPTPRTVPDVAGASFDAASAALTRLGLKVVRTDDVSDTVPKDQVVGTSPGAGASVDRGSTVSVIVSKGPAVVPSLIGLTVPDATGRLQAVGLQVGNVYGPPGGRVLLTTPLAGSKAKKGSSVTLFIF
jgi:serine/threonine-protein kinase